MAQTNTEIKHAYGSLAKVLAKIGTADGMACFGYDTDNGTGAIVVNGKLVSSKILDIAPVEEGIEGGKKQTVTITYVDTSTKAVKTKAFEAVDLATIQALIAAVKTEAGDATKAINDFLAGTTLIGAGDGIAVTPTQTTGKPTTYKVAAAVDGTSVKIVGGKIAVDTYTFGEADAAEEGYLKTYEFTVTPADGGAATKTKINIPKDLLLQKAAVEDLPAEKGTGKGIHFVVNTKENDGTPTDLWIPVKELAVSLYEGDDYIEVTADAERGNKIALKYATLLTKIKKDLTYVESVSEAVAGVLPEGNDKTFTKAAGGDTVTLNTGAWNTHTVKNVVAGVASEVEIKTVSEKALINIYEEILANEKTCATAFNAVNAYEVIREAVAAAGAEANISNEVTEDETKKAVFNQASKYVTTVTLTKGAIDGTGAGADTTVKLLNTDFAQYVLDQLALATGNSSIELDKVKADINQLKTDVSALNKTVVDLDTSVGARLDAHDGAIAAIRTTLTWVDLDA